MQNSTQLDRCAIPDHVLIKTRDYICILIRERLFNLKRGGYGFFLKKYHDLEVKEIKKSVTKNILLYISMKKNNLV